MRLVLVSLALGLIVTPAAAQTRVSVSVGIDAPPVYGHVVIGSPPYYHAHPAPVVIVERRYPRYYRYGRPGLVVVRRAHPHGRGRHHYRHRHRNGYRVYDYDD